MSPTAASSVGATAVDSRLRLPMCTRSVVSIGVRRPFVAPTCLTGVPTYQPGGGLQ